MPCTALRTEAECKSRARLEEQCVRAGAKVIGRNHDGMSVRRLRCKRIQRGAGEQWQITRQKDNGSRAASDRMPERITDGVIEPAARSRLDERDGARPLRDSQGLRATADHDAPVRASLPSRNDVQRALQQAAIEARALGSVESFRKARLALRDAAHRHDHPEIALDAGSASAHAIEPGCARSRLQDARGACCRFDCA